MNAWPGRNPWLGLTDDTEFEEDLASRAPLKSNIGETGDTGSSVLQCVAGVAGVKLKLGGISLWRWWFSIIFLDATTLVFVGGAAARLPLGLTGDTGEMLMAGTPLFSVGISVTMGVS